MDAVAIIFLFLIIVGLCAVFYAAIAPHTLINKTLLAGIGFAFIVVFLYLLGALT